MKSLLFIFVLFFGLSLSAQAQILEAKQLFNKTTVKVKEEKVFQTQTFYGQTSLDTSRVFDVVTRFDGYITKLHANEDFMLIKKEAPLFELYSNEIMSIQKELLITKSFNEKVYKSGLDRLLALGLHDKELQKIKNSQHAYENISFYAPFNAILMKRNINNGSSVKQGELLLQLANIDQLWFLAQVYQNDLALINKGSVAKLYVDGIKEPFITKVENIYPIVDATTKTVPVRFTVENKNLQLSPNMFAKVVVQTHEKTALTLPKNAVIQKGNKHFVFLYHSQEEYEPLEVEAKRISANSYEIISGLNANDEVINNALFLLDSDAVTNSLYSKDEEW
jgi:membrane fusion protein, copper/silver efflux system